MNIEIKKKLYTAPAMSVVEMRGQMNLLEDSGGHWEHEGDTTEYDDEFSFIFKDSDRMA